MTSEILVDRDGPVMTVTLNRPEKFNALTFGMYARIAEACGTVPADVRAMLITGAGAKAFAAGTDISQFRNFRTPQDGIDYETKVDEILTALECCPVPVIAAISGACTGGRGCDRGLRRHSHRHARHALWLPDRADARELPFRQQPEAAGRTHR